MMPIGGRQLRRTAILALVAPAVIAAMIILARPLLNDLRLSFAPPKPSATVRDHPHAQAAAKRPGAVEEVANHVVRVLEQVGLALALLVAVCLAVVALSALMRLHARRRRVYHAYKINLTANDQTELKHMRRAVSAMGQAVAARLTARWLRGQPAFGLLALYDPHGGGEFTLAIVCQRNVIAALDVALVKAFPGVRTGFEFRLADEPLDLRLKAPPVVVRLRKRRNAVHPIINLEQQQGLDPVLGGLAHMMHCKREWTAVWFCVVPADTGSSYVDVQIAAENYTTCNDLAGTLQNLPGAANTLVRRPMLLRRGLYRRRFPRLAPPLIMRGGRKLMTDSELAGLLQLPSAQLTVPAQRIPEPRLPAARR